jgi:hypothetical protein
VQEWLIGRGRNVYSQNGEDGFLEALFDRIGIANHWCFEVGASDGQSYSNVAHLIEQGWHAVLIEKEEADFAACVKRYAQRDDVRCVNTYVFPWSLDACLLSAGLPDRPDLGVIDIDEQDFWLWAGMRIIRPRVMVVEYGLGRPVDQIPPLIGYVKAPVPEIQAGQNMIHYLGVALDYTPLAMTETNILFVDNQCLTPQQQNDCRTAQNISV